jgi:hypothetical protein
MRASAASAVGGEEAGGATRTHAASESAKRGSTGRFTLLNYHAMPRVFVEGRVDYLSFAFDSLRRAPRRARAWARSKRRRRSRPRQPR